MQFIDTPELLQVCREIIGRLSPRSFEYVALRSSICHGSCGWRGTLPMTLSPAGPLPLSCRAEPRHLPADVARLSFSSRPLGFARGDKRVAFSLRCVTTSEGTACGRENRTVSRKESESGTRYGSPLPLSCRAESRHLPADGARLPFASSPLGFARGDKRAAFSLRREMTGEGTACGHEDRTASWKESEFAIRCGWAFSRLSPRQRRSSFGSDRTHDVRRR